MIGQLSLQGTSKNPGYALENFMGALTINLATDHIETRAELYHNVSVTLSHLGRYKEALSYSLIAIELNGNDLAYQFNKNLAEYHNYLYFNQQLTQISEEMKEMKGLLRLKTKATGRLSHLESSIEKSEHHKGILESEEFKRLKAMIIDLNGEEITEANAGEKLINLNEIVRLMDELVARHNLEEFDAVPKLGEDISEIRAQYSESRGEVDEEEERAMEESSDTMVRADPIKTINKDSAAGGAGREVSVKLQQPMVVQDLKALREALGESRLQT